METQWFPFPLMQERRDCKVVSEIFIFLGLTSTHEISKALFNGIAEWKWHKKEEMLLLLILLLGNILFIFYTHVNTDIIVVYVLPPLEYIHLLMIRWLVVWYVDQCT